MSTSPPDTRPSPSRPSLPLRKISLAASNTVYTYHCLCTHLLLATSTPLESLPTRRSSPPSSQNDMILSLAAPLKLGSLIGTVPPTASDAPVIIRSDSGFEKRYLARCARCHLTVGYQLDYAQFPDTEGAPAEGRREDTIYIIPGSMVTTREMVMGKSSAGSSSTTTGVPVGKGVRIEGGGRTAAGVGA
ncbi:hypothetical protein BU24DRAFT_465312 [Aaosphaeria arxii CBS 175.79]|uniref:STEEP1 domain-containing protein n=1 Tax=Aaosphaeria arxii CBS 175.79 TaxID=1450172 RepID=A0A6A5XJH6_9PLEO|nr:uncharacterized protein BU24DRAFT_465312 [Aaosphaeria arxii CBS 175.79]KAF2012967.1 hypothetical protein BU24DRAFT_465312 [Aaosphaeria arxii CBS 175.79]